MTDNPFTSLLDELAPVLQPAQVAEALRLVVAQSARAGPGQADNLAAFAAQLVTASPHIKVRLGPSGLELHGAAILDTMRRGTFWFQPILGLEAKFFVLYGG
jgi:hypothetical protein